MGKSKSSVVNAEMVTVSDVATLLQCGERTIYRMIEMQSIPAPARIGRLIRWPKSQLEDWIRQGCPRPAPQASETPPQ